MSALIRLSPFLVSSAITCTFFINFCSWIFQCGCHSLWAGADAACNVHAAHGKHCPWCSHGIAGYTLVIVLLCAPQLAIAAFTRWSWLMRTVVATAMFPLAGLVIALAFGQIDGYWVG